MHIDEFTAQKLDNLASVILEDMLRLGKMHLYVSSEDVELRTAFMEYWNLYLVRRQIDTKANFHDLRLAEMINCPVKEGVPERLMQGDYIATLDLAVKFRDGVKLEAGNY